MEYKVHIAICMLDRQQAEQLETLLHVWAQDMCVRIQTQWIGHPVTAMESGYGVILTDGCGLDVQARLCLRERGTACALVLVTGDERLAIDLYVCHPNALVAQPMRYENLKRAMERCFTCWYRGLCFLYVLVQRERICIPQYRIECAEAAGRNATLYCTDGVHKVNCSLTDLQQQLFQPPFLRIQKSFIVHLGAIDQIARGQVILYNGQSIPIARRLVRQVQKAFAAYVGERCVDGP